MLCLRPAWSTELDLGQPRLTQRNHVSTNKQTNEEGEENKKETLRCKEKESWIKIKFLF